MPSEINVSLNNSEQVVKKWKRKIKIEIKIKDKNT